MLRSVLDNLDGLDPSLHEHYTERDGKYYLDIEDDIRRHPKGQSLQAMIDRIKGEKNGLKEKLEAVEQRLSELPEEFDAEQYASDMDELATLRAKKGGGGDDPDDEHKRQAQKRLFEQRIQNMEAAHRTEKERLEAEKKALEADIERLVGDEQLTRQLVTVGVDKKLLPGATALLRRSVKVERDPETGRWDAFVETDVGRSSVDEYVNNWAQTDGESYVEKPKGGGAPGNNGQRLGENPWDSSNGKKPNKTRQQEIIVANPEKARALAQAAGVQPNW